MPTSLSVRTGAASRKECGEPGGPQLFGVTPMLACWPPTVKVSEPGTAGSAQWKAAHPTPSEGCRRPGTKDTGSTAVSGLSSMLV